MDRELLVFDMDGVLVDVSESYRECIVQTVQHFTGRRIERERIQDYKNLGGWNNDWELSQKICSDLGVEVPYPVVVEQFQRYFFGDGESDGLMLRERWIPRPGLLEKLAERRRLAIFTGRLREEAALTLRRFASFLRFDPVVGADDVTRPKPHPEGLQKIAAACPGTPLWYVGDTVDDARCARAAGVPFIGVADPASPRAAELRRLLLEEGAGAVIGDINQIEGVLPR